MNPSEVSAALTLMDRHGGRAGEDRIRLLEQIDTTGSISGAARVVGLSYKAAWDAVNTLNNLFPKPLVLTRAGGQSGGGAAVTPEGREVIQAFRLLHRELERFMGLFSRGLERTGPQPQLASLLWSIGMRTSARNALRGTVTGISPGSVNAEVTLAVAEGVELTAVVTNRSVENLGLAPGREALALIKASFVILATPDEARRTSARNCLCGTVSQRLSGDVNDEIILDIGQGRTIAATVTSDSAEALGLRVGDPACALIKASHVILAVD